jgi:hypothetical protein
MMVIIENADPVAKSVAFNEKQQQRIKHEIAQTEGNDRSGGESEDDCLEFEPNSTLNDDFDCTKRMLKMKRLKVTIGR